MFKTEMRGGHHLTTTRMCSRAPLAGDPPCSPPPSPTTPLTVSAVLPLLEHLVAAGDLRRGRAVHGLLLKTALTHHTLLSNRLISLYSSLPSPSSSLAAFSDLPHKNSHSYNYLLASLSRSPATLPSALRLFDTMPSASRNLVSYNVLIASLPRHGRHEQSLQIFAHLVKDRFLGPEIVMDRFTVVAVAGACASLGALQPLRQLHGMVMVLGLEMTLIMGNAMIDAYGKSRGVEDARRVFDRMGVRDSVSWTSLIAAYSWANRLNEAVLVFERMPERGAVSWTAVISGHEQNGEAATALELFERMLGEGVAPTPFALVSVLGACAKLGLVERGKQVHCFVLRRRVGLDPFNIFIHNALIGMYSKCGDMTAAVALFDRMPERDFVSWNSMVTGFSQNGQGRKSLAVFERMLGAGIQPTYVTFLSVLTACSHAGLVSDVRRILDSMQDYGIQPRAEHYAAFIDALGRNRQFEEAIEFIKGLPSKMGPCTTGSWGALLGACRVHGNLELAERVAESLLQLEPENGARYVMLSNIYAAAGHWDEARRVRALMKGKGLKKDQAYSWIEVRSVKHMFVTDDTAHREAGEIYGMLDILLNQMREVRDSVEHCLLHAEGDSRSRLSSGTAGLSSPALGSARPLHSQDSPLRRQHQH